MVSILNDSSYAGQLGISETALDLSLELGLVAVQKGRIRISQMGADFIALNRDLTYELAPGQVEFLLQRSIFTHHGKMLKSLLRRFEEDPYNKTFFARMPIENITPGEQWMFDFLRSMGVVSINGEIAFIAATYVFHASSLRASRALTAEELNLLLLLQKEQGQVAEQWVLAYERERLRAAGFVAEADSIRQISNFDVAAGYDIQSFDGHSDTFKYDRFIEVKSTSGTDQTFVWTSNEKRVATELGDKYWIYLLVQFSAAQSNANLLTIQNPVKQHRLGHLKLDSLSFRATLTRGFQQKSLYKLSVTEENRMFLPK